MQVASLAPHGRTHQYIVVCTCKKKKAGGLETQKIAITLRSVVLWIYSIIAVKKVLKCTSEVKKHAAMANISVTSVALEGPSSPPLSESLLIFQKLRTHLSCKVM